jgi:hypothetical protein
MFSTTFWPSNMKADHLRNFNSFTLPKFVKYKTTNRSFQNQFLFCLELRMYHTPQTWYEQENLGCKAHVEALPRALVFASLHNVSWITKTLRVGPTGWYTRSQTHNSALLSSLSNNVCGHKGNVLLLRNDIVFLLLARATFSTNLYRNCKFIFFHQDNIQNTSYTCKITKIHFNSQILNTNQMSTSVSPSMHYNTFLKNLVQIKHKILI